MGSGRRDVLFMKEEDVCLENFLKFIDESRHTKEYYLSLQAEEEEQQQQQEEECFMVPLDILFKCLIDSSRNHPWLRLEGLVAYFASCIGILKGHPPQDVVGDDSLQKLESSLGRVGSMVTYLHLHQQVDTQEMVDRIYTIVFSDDVQQMLTEVTGKLIVAAASETCLRLRRVKFPRIDQLGYIHHLLDYLPQVVKAKAYSLGPLKVYTWWIQVKLHFLSCFIMSIPEWRKEEAYVKSLVQRVTNLAHQTQYVIDSFLLKYVPMWYCTLYLSSIFLNLVYETGQVAFESTNFFSLGNLIKTRRAKGYSITAILNQTEASTNHNQLLNDPDIIDLYKIRTMSLVGSRTRKEVFLRLLNNYVSFGDTSADGLDKKEYTIEMSKCKLRRSLHKLLRGTTFLVILEDVPQLNALYSIVKEFLHYLRNRKGMVLLTTPSQELANKCDNGDLDSIFKDRTNSTSQYEEPEISQPEEPTKPQPNNPKNDDGDVVIGFKDETERMLELLIGGDKRLCIISITGMAGQGKTTLAKKLYKHSLVVGHFDTRLQCCVTQVYEKKELLLELLGEIVQHSALHNKNDEELAELLYKTLKVRRFLIFLDDIWDINAWNDLARCFPDDKNGSKIIFTTRVIELASQANPKSTLQTLSPLSDEESWKLLKNKVFGDKSCPVELVKVGRQIAKNCKGLPLSVIIIGGILIKVEREVDMWADIAKKLKSLILDDAETHGKGAVELSYKHLPDSLKACFLYFGAFLEDREILAEKLLRLWIAEGFIKDTEIKNLADIAQDYLSDLVGRSLVTIVKEKSTGGVKSCRIHDLLREFCLTKARDENFLLQINGYDNGTNFNYACSSTPSIYSFYRLSIYSKRSHFVMLKPFESYVRSLLFFASSDTCPNYSYDISFIFHNFKFLNILDLEEINIGDSFKEIDVLVLLRYLAVQSDVDSIPLSIANLWKLETFLFKGLSTEVVKVPDSIWDMNKLRHIHINGCVSFDLEPHRLENSSVPNDLQTFSTPSLAYGDAMLNLLGLLQGIQKLKCIFLDSWDASTSCNRFPELQFLNQLISLKVFYGGMGLYPCVFNFPSNLKKLTLSKFRMPWSEISQVASQITNLEVLKLLDDAFEGETWEMEDDQVFPSLKFLKLKALDVVEWIAAADHFPCLEHLILHKCEQLEEIPEAIGDIDTLLSIEVMWCSSSSATSAIKIQEDQLEYGKAIKVHIGRIAQESEASA